MICRIHVVPVPDLVMPSAIQADVIGADGFALDAGSAAKPAKRPAA